MRTFAVLLALGVLAGCAPTMNGANERGGMISHISGFSREDAFTLADQHCRRYGRAARISGTDPLNSTLTFDCVQ